MRLGASMLSMVGRTPVVRLNSVVPDDAGDVLVKLEWFNPTGSYKDRMALAMVEAAESRGDLRPGMSVLEYTAGSTGSSLGFVCAAKGYRLRIVTSDAFAPEKLATMRAFGAELTIVESDGGKITPDLTPRIIATARELADDPDVFWTNQLHNADSLGGYRLVGEELLDQLDEPPDVFCCAVGTAGLAMGVKSSFEAAGVDTRLVIFEPDSSPIITTGSAGDNELARELGPGSTVVTVACDTGLKYLAGGLFGSA